MLIGKLYINEILLDPSPPKWGSNEVRDECRSVWGGRPR